MPELPKFTQKYVEKLPEIDTLCPICKTGYIKQGKYSPLCFECHSAFRISKYPPKPAVEKESPKDIILIEKLDEINARLDKLGAYLKEKLE